MCSLFGGVGIANTLSTIILSIGLLASGFFIPVSQLPIILQYIDYTLITTFITPVLAINQFNTNLEYICPGDQALPDGSCPLSTGEDVLNVMDINPDTFWPYFSIALVLAVFYRFLSYLVLRFKHVKATL